MICIHLRDAGASFHAVYFCSCRCLQCSCNPVVTGLTKYLIAVWEDDKVFHSATKHNHVVRYLLPVSD